MNDVQLRAFDGSEQLKDDLLRQVQESEDAGFIVHGMYGCFSGEYDEDENGELVQPAGPWRGCAVGVIVHGDFYDVGNAFHGIPRILLNSLERIFEEASSGDEATYPRRFLEAIPVGADLSNFAPEEVWCETCQKYHSNLRKFANFDEFMAAVTAAATAPVA